MKLTEEEIKKITYETINELSGNLTVEEIKEAIKRKILLTKSYDLKLKERKIPPERVILTAFGLNKPGIIATVTKALADFNCDIEDLSQRIIGDFFTMIMIIDISISNKELKEIQNEMERIAKELKIKIYLQHEDVFRYMHRI
ncbi:MAG: ACT domain-containing protein [Melioribacter sp.]|nr:ACT domain-containing protein [Melioribacter sp.]